MSDAPEQPTGEQSGSENVLRENFSQQQAKITALKELVRQSETAKGQRTASAQEKAKNIAQRLTHLKSKSARAKHGDKSLTEVHEETAPNPTTSIHHQYADHPADNSADHTDTESQHTHEPVTPVTLSGAPFLRADSLPAATRPLPETPGSEKIQLLRRQMEQNRARMAEREHSKRDVEQLVTQLKQKFHSSQLSLDRSTSNLGRSVGDLSLDHTTTAHEWRQQQLPKRSGPDRFQSSADLSGSGTPTVAGTSARPLNFDRERIRYLEQRCADLEKQAERNAGTELQALVADLREQLHEKDSLIEARTQAVGVVSELGRTAEDQLEDTRDEWQRSQLHFADLEAELRDQLADRDDQIASLQEANAILERARFELTVRRAQEEDSDSVGGEAAAAELTAKLSEMGALNESLQQSIRDAAEATAAAEAMAATRLSALEADVERLQLENDELRRAAELQNLDGVQPDATGIAELQENVRQLQASNALYRSTNERLDAELQEKTLECSVFVANMAVLQDKLKSAAPRSLFSADAVASAAVDDSSSCAAATDEANGDVQRLRQQLDDANRAAIKTKLKQRQLQKQIDTLRRSDETARQLGELTDANATLGQRVRELEELAAAVTQTTVAPASAPTDALLQATCNNQIEAIRLLEEQKCEQAETLATARRELDELRSKALSAVELDRTAHVAGHMDAIRQEERLDASRALIEQLQTSVAAGQAERAAMAAKLQRYAAENMELLDRWDKVNKGSSAESIEIVENLTASERLEMEAIERGARPDVGHGAEVVERSQTQSSTTSPTLTGDAADDGGEAAATEASAMGRDLSDSLVQLREESSELMDRIEAFTGERREVLGKMELLQAENERLAGVVAGLHGDRAASEERCVALTGELDAAEAERSELRSTVAELQANRRELCEELNVGRREQVRNRGQAAEPVEFSGELYEKSLRSLEALLEGYRRGKDKNAKFEVSKKLAKEAKNNAELVQQLLGEHRELVVRVNELQQQIDCTATEPESGGEPSDAVMRVRALEAELADACNTIQSLESDRAAVDVQIDKLRSDLDGAHRENRTQTDRLQSVDQEREILQKLVAEQKDQLIDTITEFQQTIDEQTVEIDRLQQLNKSATAAAVDNAHVAGLNDKMVALKQLFDENNALLEQQATELAQQQQNIETLSGQLTESADQLAAKDDELSYVQELLDASRAEERSVLARWQSSEATRQQLEAQVAALEQNIRGLQDRTQRSGDLDAVQTELRAAREQIGELEARNREQLEKLKKFAANLKKKNLQCAEMVEKIAKLEEVTPGTDTSEQRQQLDKLELELLQKTDTIGTLSDELQRLQAAQVDSNILSDLRDTLRQQTADAADLSAKIAQLEQDKRRLADTLEQTVTANGDLRDRHIALEAQLSARTAELSAQTGALDALSAQMAAKIAELDELLRQQAAELQTARQALQIETNDARESHIKIDKCKLIIREKNRELKRLQELTAEQQLAADRQTDVVALTAELAAERQLLDVQRLKITEHEHYIEQLTDDRTQLQQRIAQLEQQMGEAGERAAEVDAQRRQLSERIAEKERFIEEAELSYDQNMKSASQNLLAVQSQLATVQQACRELEATLDDTRESARASQLRANEAVSRAAAADRQLEQLRDDHGRERTDTGNLVAELQRTRAECAEQQAAHDADIATLENDMSAQLLAADASRRTAVDECARQRDANAELLAESLRLQDIVNTLEQTNGDLERDCGWLRLQNEGMQQDQADVQELRMQCVHDQTEIENLQQQAAAVTVAHEAEVAELRQQLAELDSLRTQIGQNQTDDQMCIQNENERLLARLAVLESALADQQQHQQQQQQPPSGTAALFAPVAPIGGDALAVLAPPPLPPAPPSSSSDSEKLQLHEQIGGLQARLERAQHEAQAQQQRNDDLAAELAAARVQHDAEVEQLRRLTVELEAVQPRIDEAMAERAARDLEIQELRERIDSERQQAAGAVHEDVVVQAVHSQQAAAPPAAAQVAHLEQYINDLQIQLRIATNDCEQLATTQQQLEEEIQQRQRAYEKQIDELRAQMDEQQHQQPAQEPAQLANESALLSSIESQIIPQPISTAGTSASASAVPSFDGSMFFGHTTATDEPFGRLTDTADAVAVAEPAIVPKTAYVCHDGGDADDGWGFGSDEAALEEQHQAQQQQQQAQQQQQLTPALDALERDLAGVQSELAAVRTDNAALQLKSAKMLKKLKEYKARNDALLAAQQQQQEHMSRSSSLASGSSDLDLAIQEELHVQIRTLEARLKELRTEHDAGQLERANLLKRCDTLTAANERLTDMKERQDADMETCRRQQRQLQQQLDQMHDWQADDDHDDRGVTTERVDNVATLATPSQARADPAAASCPHCAELQNEVAELQACLEAEKEHIVVLEARIKKLSESLDVDSLTATENERLAGRLSESVATIDTLAGDATRIRNHLDELRREHRDKLEENRLLNEQFAGIRDKLAMMKRQLADSERMAISLEAGERLERRCEQLTALVQMREAEAVHLTERVADAEAAAKRCAEFETELGKRREEVLQLRGQIDELLLEKRQAWEGRDAKQAERDEDKSIDGQSSVAAAQLADWLADKQQMELELAVLNDQVLGSLQLEDDMRVLRLQLDAKTIEIAELKASLANMVLQQQQQPTSAPASTADVEARLNAHWTLVLEQRCAELADRWRQHMSDREDEFAAQLARHPTDTAHTQTSPRRPSPPLATGDDRDGLLEQHALQIGTLSEQLSGAQSAEATAASQAAAMRRELDELHGQLLAVQADNERLVQSTQSTAAGTEIAPATETSRSELVSSMQQALETQELEIVTLKEQLAVRSAEYARLAAQVDPFGRGVVVSSSSPAQPKGRREPTPKSELDLALYMLHQRDMRCEELTEELMSMLEERDQLQLKLAGSMRHIERLRVTAAAGGAASEVDSADITPEKQQHASGSSELSPPQAPSTRHKTLRDEREQHQRQMAILQRDVATLPPEAVAELMAGTDYDPSVVDRQRQRLSTAGAVDVADESPYTALLNLFWGPRAPANESS